ncbi:hypothetical protein EVAR_26962_1 [Eumeta japonica]|uniref:Uncharacterized protein n=1 Tax=Eumeta variegata TaxID=151549 RepID=A0A4C1VJL1_EUMVA|nr:hypothetical protein EVAR_26962_1 [Eumeta japonica]
MRKLHSPDFDDGIKQCPKMLPKRIKGPSRDFIYLFRRKKRARRAGGRVFEPPAAVSKFLFTRPRRRRRRRWLIRGELHARVAVANLNTAQ